MSDSGSSPRQTHPVLGSTITLDLSFLPPVYILASHIPSEELHDLEDSLNALHAPLTYQAKEARLILGSVSTARRARLELQWVGVYINSEKRTISRPEPAKKKAKVEYNDPSSDSEHDNAKNDTDVVIESSSVAPESQKMACLSISEHSEPATTQSSEHTQAKALRDLDIGLKQVVVARLEWLQCCLRSNSILPLSPFVVLRGCPQPVERNIPDSEEPCTSARGLFPTRHVFSATRESRRAPIVERAKHDRKPTDNSFSKRGRIKAAADKDFIGRTFSSSTRGSGRHSRTTRPPHLLHETTSEHDAANSESLPPLPDWVVNKQFYACQRATPADQANADFISRLHQIKLARLLTLDEIGVRAYSTSIAALAAYPYRLQNSLEVLALPGCDQKIGHLFHEYQTNNGRIQAIVDLEADPALKVLREFYEIWGVGAITARDFYYDKGWRDLDDIIEYGWKTLNRVQQIGLKYYDEFQLKIPRRESESIAAEITEHAKRVTDSGIQTIIVGGYRRGKLESGDVDIVVSHPKQDMTLDLVSQVVKSLEKEGWITHTLILNLTNSKRNQQPLPITPSTLRGHGFDTLDKALVVWQDPNWQTKDADLAADPKAKNPNPHRRVDIIISPWRTVGCAVAGWTSGTTFQRDLRRYAKKEKGWKFDSSGVRDRATGNWIDLEKWRNEDTRCIDWKEAERRVFEGLGLVYREPWERCTW